MKAFYPFDTDNALMLGLMCQHWRAGHIADREDAGYICIPQTVGYDAPSIHFNPESFKPQTFDIADNADG